MLDLQPFISACLRPFPCGWLCGCEQLEKRLADVKSELDRVNGPDFVDSLVGTLGVDPALYTCAGNNYIAPV